ncbi:MAG: hypothetical protein SGJ23_00690 [Alphaproteobacteria bacterium]|nr:hypothetical protein [Alphaproteobacteria bacterium]
MTFNATDRHDLADSAGRVSALTGYGLYLLSIPSLALFAPVGAAVAWFSRADAAPLARAHLDAQLRLFAMAAIWALALFALSIPAWILTIVLIGIPLLWAIALAGFIVMIWFTAKSALGLLRLLGGEMP